MSNYYVRHASAREEAFGWYLGPPPSPDEARQHFALRAKRDPANAARYAEALEVFLAMCWNTPAPAPEQKSEAKHV
ncbi:MAG TPA: hypothetical protein VFJ68_04370 [Casimicrobiaceae bacterium]|nr:hypothetical protein [Casimicrobiaceae bacterium]